MTLSDPQPGFQGHCIRDRDVTGVQTCALPICRLSRKRCEIGRWLLWNVNGKSWVQDRMVSSLMTLSDPNPGFQGHCIVTSRISFYGQSYQRTLIGNHTQSIEW